jgi:hypothetical protein
MDLLYNKLIEKQKDYEYDQMNNKNSLDDSYSMDDSYNDGGGGDEWSDPTEFW